MTNDLPSVGTEDALTEAEERDLQWWDRTAKQTPKTGKVVLNCGVYLKLRALVSERDELASRVSELEGERDWLEKRWNKVIDAAQHAHGPDAIRFKFSLRKNGTATNIFPKWLDGRWVSFVFAEDDAHIGYIAAALNAFKEHP